MTSAVCTLAEAREMTAEMIEASPQWLAQFEGKHLRPTPRIYVPPGVRPVEAPLDAALVVAHRFGALVRGPQEA